MSADVVDPPSSWRELFLVRTRTFFREPGIVFWVFGFPILLAIALGIAFREKGPERAAVAVVPAVVVSSDTTTMMLWSDVEKLDSPLLDARPMDAAAARAALDRGEVVAIVRPGTPPVVQHDPTRPGAAATAALVVDALERAGGRRDLTSARLETIDAPGRRYIDFLIPGLIGMGLMGGGLWGVGYAIVTMRVRRLLKRLAATPMSRPAFLGSFLLHRLILAALEVGFLLAFGALAFGLVVRGSVVDAVLIGFLGAISFGALGLLIGCRARNLETANGLMNLAMLPMWLLSGVFFSTGNFPDWMRPAVKALPLTALNDALRAVVNDGASLASRGEDLAILAAWAVVSFVLALKWFRWS